MIWNRNEYLITISDPDGKYRQKVTGITTNMNGFEIGIHKATRCWLVTDISTGYLLHMQATQTKAREWVEENAETIMQVINNPKHQKHVEEVKKCKIK